MPTTIAASPKTFGPQVPPTDLPKKKGPLTPEERAQLQAELGIKRPIKDPGVGNVYGMPVAPTAPTIPQRPEMPPDNTEDWVRQVLGNRGTRGDGGDRRGVLTNAGGGGKKSSGGGKSGLFESPLFGQEKSAVEIALEQKTLEDINSPDTPPSLDPAYQQRLDEQLERLRLLAEGGLPSLDEQTQQELDTIYNSRRTELDAQFQRERDTLIAQMFGSGAQQSTIALEEGGRVLLNRDILANQISAEQAGTSLGLRQARQQNLTQSILTEIGVREADRAAGLQELNLQTEVANAERNRIASLFDSLSQQRTSTNIAGIGAQAGIRQAEIGASAQVQSAKIGAAASVESSRISASAAAESARLQFELGIRGLGEEKRQFNAGLGQRQFEFGVDSGQRQYGLDLQKYGIDVSSTLAKEQMALEWRLAQQRAAAEKKANKFNFLGALIGGAAQIGAAYYGR